MILVVLLAPTIILAAASKFTPAAAIAGENNTVTVPLIVGNGGGLMAMDIPLVYSEGVTLREVTFTGTRVEYFDLKLANIDNEKNRVIIGLITQASAEAKPLLAAGEGTVANLVFTIDDPSLTEITIEAANISKPHHSLLYVYIEEDGKHVREAPTFDGMTIALSGGGGVSDESLPAEYGLDQNYPNPFNPTTEISFALPQASHVRLTVYNVLGQRVRTLIDEEMPAGVHTKTWDGRNSGGGSVASGVYFYELFAGSYRDSHKMLMLK